MDRRNAATLLMVLAIVAGGVPPAGAQLSVDLGVLSDENARMYLGPLPDALSGMMSSAIFTSGKVPRTGLNFSVGVKATAIRFSDEDRLFTPTDPAGFTSVPPVRQAPTVVGGSAPVAQVGQGGAILVYPGGYDIGAFASAAPQLAIGSVMGTRAVVRWLSYRLSVDDLVDRISFFGIGAQHSISQYFRAAPVDLALGVFYQTLRANASLVDARAFHADITGSRSFSVLQPYAALGFDSFKMDVVYQDAANPGYHVAVDFDRRTNLHLTAGVLASLAFVTLHAEADIAATNGVAVGLSLGRQ